MDFLHGTHRQSRVSEVVYVALNLGLATLLFLIRPRGAVALARVGTGDCE